MILSVVLPVIRSIILSVVLPAIGSMIICRQIWPVMWGIIRSGIYRTLELRIWEAPDMCRMQGDYQ